MEQNRFPLPQKSAKKDFIFNMYGSMTVSFISVALLVVVSHILDEVWAGVFSLAYSTAQMLYTLAMYEVRNIQVTDSKGEFSFSDCLTFRLLTIVFMLLAAFGFCMLQGFSAEKFTAIMLLCAYMAFLALAEVFQGNAHKNGYLFLSGFSLGTSVLLAAVSFVITLLLTKDLLTSIVPMIVVMGLWALLVDLPISRSLGKVELCIRWDKLKLLLRYATPLILSVFMNQYAFNCPKYAINRYLTDVDQSHYGYLVMPAFCINLLSMFVFQPQLLSLSESWAKKAYKKFNRQTARLFGWVVLVTVVVLAGGYVLGIPVLNLLYGTDLNSHKALFMVLLLGGGFSAGSSLCCVLVAVTRKQNYALIAYVVSTVIALVLPNILVEHMGFSGAPVSYLLQNIVLFTGLLLVLSLTVFSKSKHNKEK